MISAPTGGAQTGQEGAPSERGLQVDDHAAAEAGRLAQALLLDLVAARARDAVQRQLVQRVRGVEIAIGKDEACCPWAASLRWAMGMWQVLHLASMAGPSSGFSATSMLTLAR